MSNPITDLLTGGLSGIVGSVTDILGKFITDPAEKLKATLQIQQMANDLQVKVIEADRDMAVQQASVIVAEAKSDSWIARNWRPITMLSFVFIIDYNFVLAPIFSLKFLPIPPQLWTLLTIGIGGYIGTRSIEKTAAIVVQGKQQGKQNEADN